MDSGRLVFDSGVARRAAAGGGQMLLFGGGGGFIRGVPRPALTVEEGRSKRPFFTTHEELLEEEYYDEQMPEKKRRLTPEQVRLLESSFEEENKLEPERKSELARRLGMAPRQVAVWFQNRRARWKTKHLEQEYDRLKAAHDALLADHGDLLKDNDHLRSQVTSLTEKLQAKELSGSETAGPECELDEQTAAAAAAAAAQRKGEDHLGSETNASAVLDVAEGTHHSGQSYFTGEEGRTGGILSSSSEEDGGVVSDDGCSFFSDALFAVATEHHREHAEEVEAQLGSWTWFWN